MGCDPLQESIDHQVPENQLVRCGYGSAGQPLAPHLSTDGIQRPGRAITHSGLATYSYQLEQSIEMQRQRSSQRRAPGNTVLPCGVTE